MLFWGTIALVTLVVWLLSGRRKVPAVIAALSCFALLYTVGFQTGATATDSRPSVVRQ
ncbi:hypothetical protein [Streptomyces sp. AK04-3B]|uniref:hypothetical protein n=1 Tax=unclassified Streptomyces TaxID=2593676 RepID=UPI0029BB9B27|nr:hypothetical protein [Streptomyces sp. AK04-3B]MDX3801241.1 hypothetical protein [Streptomyces sp. AK04-3B]